MFIAHLPAGYVLTTTLQKWFKTKRFLWVGVLASIVPDLDVFYFYFIDNREHLHHSYWIHIPFYWALISATCIFLIHLLKKKEYLALAVIFFSNIFLHLLLDTIVGKIEWLYPFSEKSLYLFDVPAVYSWWVLNFIFHWTFLFELAVIAWAIFILFNRIKTNRLKRAA